MIGALGTRGAVTRPLGRLSRVTPYGVAVGVTALAIVASLLLDLPIDAYAFPLLGGGDGQRFAGRATSPGLTMLSG
jgi:hypothetical protein